MIAGLTVARPEGIPVRRRCWRDTAMTGKGNDPDNERLDRIVAKARRESDERRRGYRARALALFPWVCGRCGREFTRANVHELTVHHRDHNHENNPPDGSNWELLCLYCHDNEHQRLLNATTPEPPGSRNRTSTVTHNPFADLGERLKKK